MRKSRESNGLRRGAIGAYSSSPVPLDELGPPPADWFNVPSEPSRVSGERSVDAAVASSTVPHTDLVSAMEEVRRANVKLSAALTVAQKQLERVSRQAQRSAETLREVLGLNNGQDLSFVVPTLEAADPIHRTVIASEDVRAFDRMRLGLGNDGLQSSVTVLMGKDDPVSPDPRNLMLFCRDERNPMTKAFLAQHRLGLQFVEVGTRSDGRAMWAIRREGGELLESDSYQQEVGFEAELRETGDDERRGVFTCPALVVRTSNPYNPQKARAVLLAGVRAFGTWGAAEFLCSTADDLLVQTGGDDFVALLRIEADAYFRRCRDEGGPARFSTMFERIRSHSLLDLKRLSTADDRRRAH